jgi:isoquinoline 1-oxidoreductase subunit alpha
MASLNVNGKQREVEAEADTPLLWVLREQIGLTGTKYGCGIAQCGACTVHIDGEPVRSCVRPISSVSASNKVVTIEGLSGDGSHPLQKTWAALDVPQCGFCQCGMIMAAAALLKAKPRPTDADIDAAITNICRCGT